MIPQRSVSHQAPDIAVNQSHTPVRSRLQQYKDAYTGTRRRNNTLDLTKILDGGQKFELQKIDPDFTDSKNEYFKAFEKDLEKLNGSNSSNSLYIEEYLIKSERQWYGHFNSAGTARGFHAPTLTAEKSKRTIYTNYWGLSNDFKSPTGLKLFMQLNIGEWPIYTIFLALGQIIATSSYQITLISGTVGQTPEKLYVIASIYLATSICWWILYRTLKSVYVLSVPFIFYGIAFLLLGTAPFATSINMRGWIQNVATAMYAVASSSGSLFLSLNFGDEGGSPVKSWTFRACVMQGTQQIYICVTWAWGSFLTISTSNSINPHVVTTSNMALTGIGFPIAFLFFGIAYVMWASLPPYYHQQPGRMPSFYFSLLRRRIVVWFFFIVIVQNYFLSTLTGRNWAYLWSSNHARLLKALKSHSWILPLAAIGLGAPRWGQILWSCSNIDAWVPWAGSVVDSALVGRSLWLWLGVLDALQGVGFGMLLMQTLTRVHVAYTLIVAQVLGSIATILARATAPYKVGPSGMFPGFSRGAYPGVGQPCFWVNLIFQLLICVGFFTFFRKEQLNKP
ncbi:hypothetical protein BKA65DRAFT_527674 [Rhexocercosporidium sp. MPI-PUGE-AT-0058]|nr:hypothetical protein BKA65DRAFT_527674 [Rhexocercosporidium sp. MPI-PUGE-AT-0058]